MTRRPLVVPASRAGRALQTMAPGGSMAAEAPVPLERTVRPQRIGGASIPEGVQWHYGGLVEFGIGASYVRGMTYSPEHGWFLVGSHGHWATTPDPRTSAWSVDSLPLDYLQFSPELHDVQAAGGEVLAVGNSSTSETTRDTVWRWNGSALVPCSAQPTINDAVAVEGDGSRWAIISSAPATLWWSDNVGASWTRNVNAPPIGGGIAFACGGGKWATRDLFADTVYSTSDVSGASWQSSATPVGENWGAPDMLLPIGGVWVDGLLPDNTAGILHATDPSAAWSTASWGSGYPIWAMATSGSMHAAVGWSPEGYDYEIWTGSDPVSGMSLAVPSTDPVLSPIDSGQPFLGYGGGIFVGVFPDYAQFHWIYGEMA